MVYARFLTGLCSLAECSLFVGLSSLAVAVVDPADDVEPPVKFFLNVPDYLLRSLVHSSYSETLYHLWTRNLNPHPVSEFA